MSEPIESQEDNRSVEATRAAVDDFYQVYNGNINLAAVGNQGAQAAIARAAYDLAVLQDCAEMMSAARWWGRIAAAHGLRDDRLALAGILVGSALQACRASAREVAESYQDEAIRVLSPLVAAGDEFAIKYSNEIAGCQQPVIVVVEDQPEFAQYLWAVDMAGQA